MRVTHIPQTRTSHTCFIGIPGMPAIRSPAIDKSSQRFETCNLSIRNVDAEGTRRRVLSGGTKRDVRHWSKHTIASIWLHSHALGIHTHAKGAPLGFYTTPGRDRIHTHRERRGEKKTRHTPQRKQWLITKFLPQIRKLGQ